IRDQIQTPEAIRYVHDQLAERIGNHGQAVKAEIAERRDRLASADRRIKQLVGFVAHGDRSPGVRAELAALEAEAKEDRDAIARLEREAKEKPALPTIDELTRG